MNNSKFATVLNKIFHICFFVCMIATFVGSLAYGYYKSDTYKDANGKWQTKTVLYSARAHMVIYAAAVLLLVLFCLLYYLSKKDFRGLRTSAGLSAEAKFRIILFSVTGLIFAVQLYIGHELMIHPLTDLLNVSNDAASFAKSGSFDAVRENIANGSHIYLARYPNNFAITMILAVVFRIWYLLFGYIPQYVPVVMNCFAITVSLFFAVLMAKHMWGRRKAVYVLFLFFIFTPFYLYVPFYYTDSLSMPFGVLGLYLFMLGLKAEKTHRVRKYLLLAAAGALLFIGFKVKGSIGIIFAAVLIYSLLKYKLKEFVCIALALIVGFGSFAVMFKVGYNTLGLVTQEQADRYEYPKSHWVMMGLNGKGGYSLADSNFTNSFPSKEEKQEANVEQIKSRLKSLIESHKLIEHFYIKASWMWRDGLYFISGHIKDYVQRSYLHDFVLREGKYYYICFGYSNAYQLVLLLMMVFSLLKGIKKPKINFMVVIKGSVFALYLFLLIWEGRSRYLFNMTPLFIMMMADGIFYLTESFKNHFTVKSNKPATYKHHK